MIYMYVYVSCVFKAERFAVACSRIFLLNSSKCSINLKTKINKQVKTPKEKWRVIEEDPSDLHKHTLRYRYTHEHAYKSHTREAHILTCSKGY